MKEKLRQLIFDDREMIKTPLRIGITVCVFVILLAEACFLYYHSPKENEWLVCIFYKITGLYCPGCGSGRASYSILHGQLYQAFRYNPLLVMLLPWLGMYIGVCGIQWLFTGRETVSRHIPIQITYIIMGIVVIYGMLRNIDMYPFVLLAPTRVM